RDRSRSAIRSCVAGGRPVHSALSSFRQALGGSMGAGSCCRSAPSVLSPGSCASTGAASSPASAAVDSLPGSGAVVVARADGSGISVSLAFGWRSFRSTAAASCVERYAGVSAGALRSSAYEAGASAPTSIAKLVMMVLLGREVSQFLGLGLGKLAVVGNDHEMVLDQAEDLHREPQPLAGIGVAGGRVAPAGDVIGLDLSKDLFEQLTAEQLLSARATGDRDLELVVGHLKRPTEPRRPPPRRRDFLRRGGLPPLSAATNSRPTACGMPSVDRPAAAAYMARRCLSETGGMRTPQLTRGAGAVAPARLRASSTRSAASIIVFAASRA